MDKHSWDSENYHKLEISHVQADQILGAAIDTNTGFKIMQA
jgi:hypothetical protein